MNNNSHVVLKKTLACLIIYLIPLLVIFKNFFVGINSSFLISFLSVTIDVLQFLLPYILLILLIKAQATEDVRGVELAIIFLMIILNYLLQNNHLYLNIVNINTQQQYNDIVDIFNGLWLLLLISYFTVIYGKQLSIKDVNNAFYNSAIKIFLLLMGSVLLIFFIDYSRILLIELVNWLPNINYISVDIQNFLSGLLEKFLIIFTNIYDGTNSLFNIIMSKISVSCQGESANYCFYGSKPFIESELYNNLLFLPTCCYLFYKESLKDNKHVCGLLFLSISILAFIFGYNQVFYIFLFFVSKRLLVLFSILNGINTMVMPQISSGNLVLMDEQVLNIAYFFGQENINFVNLILIFFVFISEISLVRQILNRTDWYSFGTNEVISFQPDKVELTMNLAREAIIENEIVDFLTYVNLEHFIAINLVSANEIKISTNQRIINPSNFSHYEYLIISVDQCSISITNEEEEYTHMIYLRLIEYHYNVVLLSDRETLVAQEEMQESYLKKEDSLFTKISI